MLNPQDLQKLEQLAKEARELPYFHPHMLFELFFGGNGNILYDICIDDDGHIDPQENELLHWYFSFFMPQVMSNRDVADAALNVVFSNL